MRIISLFAVILICGFVTSCGTTASYYKTMQQPSVESPAIRAAHTFKIKSIDFSEIEPTSLGYADAEEWKADLYPVPSVFADALLKLSDKAGMNAEDASRPKYKVIMLTNDEPVTSGIVVAVVVKSIVQKWTYFSNEPDEFLCNITFTDTSNGQELFSGIVNVNSRQTTLYLGGKGSLFSVGPGMSFSGRLKAAAKNLADVLTTIMTKGKIDPAYR